MFGFKEKKEDKYDFSVSLFRSLTCIANYVTFKSYFTVRGLNTFKTLNIAVT